MYHLSDSKLALNSDLHDCAYSLALQSRWSLQMLPQTFYSLLRDRADGGCVGPWVHCVFAREARDLSLRLWFNSIKLIMEDVWTLIQFSTSGAFGIMVLLFYFVAIIQLCRAKFFFLEPTDTFLFYYCFTLGLITTTSHFVDFNMLWNMEHSLELLLQVIFCFIFALIIDPNKRIFLFLHLFYLAATLVIVIFVVQTILVSLLSDWRVGNDWKCSGYLGIIVPGASFLFSGILAIFAIVATKAA